MDNLPLPRSVSSFYNVFNEYHLLSVTIGYYRLLSAAIGKIARAVRNINDLISRVFSKVRLAAVAIVETSYFWFDCNADTLLII